MTFFVDNIDLSYNDIIISPGETSLSSRKEAIPYYHTRANRFGNKLLPLVCAPMSNIFMDRSICNSKGAIEKLHGSLTNGDSVEGFRLLDALKRRLEREQCVPFVLFPERDIVGFELAKILGAYYGSAGLNIGTTISVNWAMQEGNLNRLGDIMYALTGCVNDLDARPSVLLDAANGASPAYITVVDTIAKLYPLVDIWVGNIAGVHAYREYAKIQQRREQGDEFGNMYVRVGIGGGSACLTRVNTGIGRGNVSILREIQLASVHAPGSLKVVADGGIKNNGDAVKALALGADLVMSGKLFASLDESGLEVDDAGCKLYYGLASDYYNSKVLLSDRRYSPEGTVGSIPASKQVPADKFFDDFEYNLRSAMSYLGARTLDEIPRRATIHRVTSETLAESRAHI
jgi:IMP dehydrogenase/GMP reductase